MSRGLTQQQIDALSKEGAIVKILVHIFNGIIDWKFCTGSEAYGDYSPRAIKISAASAGKISGIHTTIEIDNRDDALSSAIKVDGLVNATAEIQLLTKVDDVSVVIMTGDVTRCNIADDMKIEVGPLNKGMKNAGLWKASRMCPYTFKEEPCRYTGADTECRRTLPDCTSKGNNVNFGGFIWALESGESILIADAQVVVEPPDSSDSNDETNETCGRQIMIRDSSGVLHQATLLCHGLEEPVGDHTDGNYVDPWSLIINGLEDTGAEI